MKQVALIIAFTGFQPIEYAEPKKILEEAGIRVVTLSTHTGEARSSIGTTVAVDATIDKFDPSSVDGIFLIGGPGALADLDTAAVATLMRRTIPHVQAWGAICIAPRILARAGMIRGKSFTGWNNDGELPGIAQRSEALYVPHPCVVDGTLVTADGPSSARAFGESIVRLMAHA